MAWSRILTTEAETIREVSAAYWKRKREEEENGKLCSLPRTDFIVKEDVKDGKTD